MLWRLVTFISTHLCRRWPALCCAGEAAGAEAEEAVDIAVAAATSPVQEEDKESDDEADREVCSFGECVVLTTSDLKTACKRKVY